MYKHKPLMHCFELINSKYYHKYDSKIKPQVKSVDHTLKCFLATVPQTFFTCSYLGNNATSANW